VGGLAREDESGVLGEVEEGELFLDGGICQERSEDADGEVAGSGGAGGAVAEEELAGGVAGFVIDADIAEVGEAVAADGEVSGEGFVGFAADGALACGGAAGDVEGELVPCEGFAWGP
jgi:hypothetical protein